jgi:hypothetical protein
MKLIIIKSMIFSALIFSAIGCGMAQEASLSQSSPNGIEIRTERYPRPPYSSAVYYIYERDGKDICTKLEMCDKFDSCESKYVLGSYKAPEDVRTGRFYGSTPTVRIPKEKLSKHMCLTKFSLLGTK